MTLARETNLGTISVSNLLFAQIIAESFKLEPCKGKVWPSSKKGRQIGSNMKFHLSEFANAIEVDENPDNGRLDIEFSIIVKFGTSIRSLCEVITDHIAQIVEEKQGYKPNQIKVRIAGVKSKQVAKRNLEVIKRYGIKG